MVMSAVEECLVLGVRTTVLVLIIDHTNTSCGSKDKKNDGNSCGAPQAAISSGGFWYLQDT